MNNKVYQKFMHGKKGLVMGVANNRSIAWGIAKALSDAGAELAFSYQGEAIEKRIIPLARELNSNITIECDVSDEASNLKSFEKYPKLNKAINNRTKINLGFFKTIF